LVLGRPGGGYSTFLEPVSGEHNGLKAHKDSEFHYNGIAPVTNMHSDLVLTGNNSDVNKHFPRLTVRET
jgi:hypothetical protein